jgi:predicted kinase
MIPTRPLVIALMGLPGAGKSTLARGLATHLDLHVVDRDAIRAAMFPRCAFSVAEKLAAFRALLAAIDVNCALGRSSIVDGVTFSRRGDLEQLDAVVRGYPVDTVALYLDCPPGMARARIAADVAAGGHPAGDRSPQLVDTVMARFDPPPASAALLDASAPPAALLAQALAALETARSGG